MKKFMTGIIAGALLVTALPVAAEEITKKVTATVRGDFSIELDGKQVTLEHSPLAYNGFSYLPVRELAHLLGKEVDFKDGVIQISTPSKTSNVQDIGFVIESKKDFDKVLSVLEDNITENELYLSRVKAAIEQIKEEPETKAADVVILFENKEKYEDTISTLKQKIAALKANYPEYAEAFD